MKSAGAWIFCPGVCAAQSADSVATIAVLLGYAEADPEARSWVTTFVAGLAEHGLKDGQTVRVHQWWANGDPERIRQLSEELARLRPNVIVAASTPVVSAALRVAGDIPTVFVNVADPVGQGFVTSLARPGGNVTGFSSYEFSIGVKWIGLLKELTPRLTTVPVLYKPRTTPYAQSLLRPMQDSASSFGVRLAPVLFENPADIGDALEPFAQRSDAGLIVLPSSGTTISRSTIISQAARQRLPAIYPWAYFVASGGLLSYGVDVPDLYRRAAWYTVQILHRTKAGDLPVQQPTTYKFFVNVKTAHELGLTIPPSLLARADEMIE